MNTSATTQAEYIRARSALLSSQLSAHPDPWTLVPGQEAPKRAITVAAVAPEPLTVCMIGNETGYTAELAAGAALLGVPCLTAPICPCGNYADPMLPCTCDADKIETHYRATVDLLLRAASICIETPRVPLREIETHTARRGDGYTDLTTARDRVTEARDFTSTWTDNETLSIITRQAITELQLSPRLLDTWKIVATCIAQLDGARYVLPEHLLEAIQYRPLDRLYVRRK